MLRNLLVTLFFSIILLSGTSLILTKLNKEKAENMLFPLSNHLKDQFNKPTPLPSSELENDEIINILLLGIDRRSRLEAYRTDIMILLSINRRDKRAVLTSVPRDLWVNGERINAMYILGGWEPLQDAFYKLTGQKPQRYILTDFADFSWIVDAMDGVPVNVERSFTDYEYPEDATKTYQTISFTEGPEVLTGSRALIYARSRHGNNGEGSDWMRMKRQHLILRGMLTAVLNPKSLFNPMIVENAFKTITEGKMDTNLTLDDAKYLWEFYNEKDLYTIESLFMDDEFVYNPPMSEYGGAWVLVPRDTTNAAFHEVVKNKILGIEPIVEPTHDEAVNSQPIN